MFADKLVKLSSRERIAIAVALVVIAFWIVNWLVVGRVRHWFLETKKAVVVQGEKLAQNRLILAQKEQIEGQAQQYAQFRGQAKSLAEENADLLSAIENMARDSSVNLVGTKPLEPRTGELADTIGVEIEVESSMENLKRFLYAIHSDSRLFGVDKIDIAPSSKSESGGIRGMLSLSRVIVR